MNPKLIVINGKTYNSVDELPEDVRKQFLKRKQRLAPRLCLSARP